MLRCTTARRSSATSAGRFHEGKVTECGMAKEKVLGCRGLRCGRPKFPARRTERRSYVAATSGVSPSGSTFNLVAIDRRVGLIVDATTRPIHEVPSI